MGRIGRGYGLRRIAAFRKMAVAYQKKIEKIVTCSNAGSIAFIYLSFI